MYANDGSKGVGRMTRKVGDTYRPIVHILKVKKDKPTVIKVSGEEYVLRHKNQYRGKRKNG